jgi:hypothetical protein
VWSEPTKIGQLLPAAIGLFNSRSMSIVLLLQITAMKPSRTDSASMGSGPGRFSPHFDEFFCFGLLFEMSSEHKN